MSKKKVVKDFPSFETLPESLGGPEQQVVDQMIAEIEEPALSALGRFDAVEPAPAGEEPAQDMEAHSNIPEWNQVDYYNRTGWGIDSPTPWVLFQEVFQAISFGMRYDMRNLHMAMELAEKGFIQTSFEPLSRFRPPSEMLFREGLQKITTAKVEVDVRAAIGSEQFISMETIRNIYGDKSPPKLTFLWNPGEGHRFEIIPGSHFERPRNPVIVDLSQPQNFLILHPRLQIRDLFTTVNEGIRLAETA